MRLIPIFLLLSLRLWSQNSFPALGSWREHLPYQNASDVTASDNKIYCATPYSLFSIDKTTKEIERLGKPAGLSESGISTIKFDRASKKLLIAYSNSNIDVMDSRGINNIPELKRENIPGDKNIYSIYTDNKLAYLATGLGVIVLDLEKYEINDSWFIGNNGNYVKTTGFAKNNGFFYAATEQGLKKVSLNQPNKADFNNWQLAPVGISTVGVRSVLACQNKTFVLKNDSLFVENVNGFSFVFADGWPIVSVNSTEDRLLVSQRQTNGAARVLVLQVDGSIQRTVQQNGLISFPRTAILDQGNVWVADLYAGLSAWTNGAVQSFIPNSPSSISTGGMTASGNVLVATAGSVNDAWNYLYNRNGFFILSSGQWTNYNNFSIPALDTLLDFITAVIDPRDQTIWAGSYGGGLFHLKANNQIEIFKQNSPIASAIGDPASYRISGLAFDNENNLWVSNYGANRPLHVLKNNGSWQSFVTPFQLAENAVADIVIDDAGQKWIVAPKGNGLIVLDHNGTIDNANDDKWRIYRGGAGIGNLPSSQVLTIAKDKSGFIWVGTDDGIGVIQCPQEAFAGGCEAVLPIIKEGNFANYLFKGQQVRSIAVDGADRKWIATASGVWLVASEGDEVLNNFTESNSPLLSNDVKTIAINGATGEVFFATAKGICSFRGTATEAAETKSDVLVFPNPVPPGFNGNIGIRGLPENSTVKITESNGRLVYQTRALGGQATWNGKDYTGRQASSGVYLVIATDDLRQEKVVTKIVFISK